MILNFVEGFISNRPDTKIYLTVLADLLCLAVAAA